MPSLKPLRDAFATLQKRDRVLAIATVAIVLVLGSNLLVLKPQKMTLDGLQARERANNAELVVITQQLAELEEAAKTGGLFAVERARLAELKAQIAEVDTFFAQSDASVAQVSSLIRSVIQENAGLTLVSLRMRPSEVFYAPPVPPKVEQETAITAVMNAHKKPEPVPVALTDKMLYKHGLEVNIKGSYPVLVAYLERLQAYPKRLFWHEASISVQKYPETTMKLVVYTLSDQVQIPLN